MAWNQPGEDNKRAAQRSGPDSSPLDELLRRLQRRMQQLWRPGRSRLLLTVSLLALGAALWLLSGIHQVADSERAVVQHFGRYEGIDQPGIWWHWPWPIDTVRKIDVADVDALDSKALMLTADQNVLDVSWSVQYRVADPFRFLFRVREPQDSLRQSSETVIRELVATQLPSALLDGDSPARLAVEARGRLQKIMDEYDAGLDVAAVNFSDVRLPDAVQGAQREVSKAADDRQRVLADAQAYANDIVPKAQSLAQQRISEAQAYATQTRATAEGDAERFAAQAQAYARAPEVTRSRLYIDTMEAILANAHKIVIDTHSGKGNTLNGVGSVVYIPLDKLAEAIRASASAPAAAAPAGGATASAGSQEGAGTGGASAPAAGGSSDGNASNEPPDDSHSRERPER
jgi:membrane protease subunit HflK